MLYVSEKAKERILEISKKENYSDNHFIRVSVIGGGCSGLSYKMDFDDQSKEGDQVYEDKGIKLVTDIKSMLYLYDTTLDFSDGLNGKGFEFKNPNATRTCSCGESFAV